ncbi:GNAT family N-acetyltransferase [Paenibacillus paridis]|uniref:GNAT family N-acetyltransferase n=1 Tax=Paenibacillus paridis TaxID=2583376 RepID=UPI001123FFDE|nr:GNAT family N-acetyltransferase [Paenibacillus paridis]
MNIERAAAEHIPSICEIDSLVIGSRSREQQLTEAVAKQQCIVAIEKETIIGFAVFDASFFGYDYLSLLIVNPSFRRKGAARALIQYIESHCTTAKLFTSTNESNATMQRVCESVGFERSGIIENLDDGDPEWIYFKPLPTRFSD